MHHGSTTIAPRVAEHNMIKLYKFRPLGDECSFCRVRRIIETDKFWCSRFWELNDPMEGVFTFNASDGIDASVIFAEKSRYAICSFSSELAFSNPVMWGHYANAFKGIAIEIEVEACANQLYKIKYVEHVQHLDNTTSENDRAIRILTTKLKKWKHECEYRFLFEQESRPENIGDITRIYFGDPYSGLTNSCEIYRKCLAIPRYHAFRDELKSIAAKKNISCTDVRISWERGLVEPVTGDVA